MKIWKLIQTRLICNGAEFIYFLPISSKCISISWSECVHHSIIFYSAGRQAYYKIEIAARLFHEIESCKKLNTPKWVETFCLSTFINGNSFIESKVEGREMVMRIKIAPCVTLICMSLLYTSFIPEWFRTIEIIESNYRWHI